MRIVSIIAAAAIAVGTPVMAQGVPDFAFDLTAGTGAHTLRVPSAYYRPEHAAMLRATGTFALARGGSIRPILAIDIAGSCLSFLCSEDDVCPIAPDGSCERYFRAPGGVGVGLGAEAAWSRYIVGSVTGGLASPFSRHIAFVGANIGLRLSSHVAWTFDLRRYGMDNEHSERVWFAPFTTGLRLY